MDDEILAFSVEMVCGDLTLKFNLMLKRFHKCVKNTSFCFSHQF